MRQKINLFFYHNELTLCSRVLFEKLIVSQFDNSFPVLCPERLWGPPSPLSNGYQELFPWG
jgi:hypothetical protein